MILAAQARSNKATLLFVGSVIFITVFVGLVYNHFNQWHAPESQPAVSIPLSHKEEPKPAPASSSKDDLRRFYLEHVYPPSLKVNDKKYQHFGAFPWELPKNVDPYFKKPLGENLCIIDLDNRPFDQNGGIFGSKPMSWDNAGEIHGLSTGVLNHYVYAKIHGYKYYYIEVEDFEDRRNSWKKPPVIAEILKDHDVCIFLDSDAVFAHMELPFEWLMNYWNINPNNGSLALALDPQAIPNLDKFGKVYANTGFIVAQNHAKTFEILKAWENCPNDDSIHPECIKYRDSKGGSGHPTDQGGFGNFIRYDFAADIRELPCTEANGFLESKSGCAGQFIKHLWTGKKNWIKVVIGQQLPGKFLELFHELFLAEKKDFYVTEKELMAGKTHPKPEKPEKAEGAQLEAE